MLGADPIAVNEADQEADWEPALQVVGGLVPAQEPFAVYVPPNIVGAKFPRLSVTVPATLKPRASPRVPVPVE